MFWLLLISSGLLYLLYVWIKMKPHNFPPGPPYFPFIGSTAFIPGKHLHLQIDKWSKDYGPVIGLFLGSQPAIAVSDPSTVLEILKRDEFQGRPDNDALRERNLNKRLGIMFNDGHEWLEQRRFTLRHLKDFGLGKTNMETFSIEEIEELMNELENKTVQVSGLFSLSILNLLWTVMAGVRYKHDDPELKELINNISVSFRAGNVAGATLRNLFPFLKRIAPHLVENETSATVKQLHAFLRKAIHEHWKFLDEDNPKDFIDAYISEISQKATKSSSFSEDMLVVICMDLFLAGAESVGNTLGFALVYMVLYPEVQERVYKEIDSQLGHAQQPTLKDRPRLPYTEAVIMEVQRINTIAPLSVPHMVTRDTQLKGYSIPKGTNVIVSLWKLLQDKDHWRDALNFSPERFLDQSGKIIKDEWFIPFGYGKRLCPGEIFTRNNLFLFFTSIFQKFKVTLPPGYPKPSTLSLSGFTSAPQPFEVTFTLR